MATAFWIPTVQVGAKPYFAHRTHLVDFGEDPTGSGTIWDNPKRMNLGSAQTEEQSVTRAGKQQAEHTHHHLEELLLGFRV